MAPRTAPQPRACSAVSWPGPRPYRGRDLVVSQAQGVVSQCRAHASVRSAPAHPTPPARPCRVLGWLCCIAIQPSLFFSLPTTIVLQYNCSAKPAPSHNTICCIVIQSQPSSLLLCNTKIVLQYNFQHPLNLQYTSYCNTKLTQPAIQSFSCNTIGQ